MVAAIVAPLAAGNSDLYTTLAVALAVMAGIACVIAGFFRLGFLADFLGKPVLVGFPDAVFPSLRAAVVACEAVVAAPAAPISPSSRTD